MTRAEVIGLTHELPMLRPRALSGLALFII
jgi:hypothetical protein